ncbi:Nucleobindin-1 isoform 1 [Schistosoma japonicum]|uniref:Nucleobindin-1 isoform 1 n=1 Tax=Schistosoma japonicum TaxID=6182 RepID=A0A4Z2DFY9_SCHJA|nr:Nucleobindin-1 isoform 1 [Schistosoma japonicum]
MISVFLFVLTFQYIISVPVIPNYEMPEEAAQYEKYLEEAPKALNVDDHILASAKRLIKENIVDRLKKLDSEQETKYQKHVEEEKNNTVRRFLKHSDEERAAMLRHFKESAERHRRRPKIYQPGSEDQLKEYWEKYEGLDRESFNPRTLFADIDLDGDGYLNVNEIEAFLQREIEKVYNPEDPDFDPWEEKYDQIKMRQKFMERFDTDKDYFISREEFLKNVKVPYVLGDHYWKTAQDVEDMFETDESELRRLASEAQSLEKDHLTDAPNLHQTTEQPNVQKT